MSSSSTTPVVVMLVLVLLGGVACLLRRSFDEPPPAAATVTLGGRNAVPNDDEVPERMPERLSAVAGDDALFSDMMRHVEHWRMVCRDDDAGSTSAFDPETCGQGAFERRGWLALHERFVDESSAHRRPLDVIFYGDSITESFRGTSLGRDCRGDRCEGIPQMWSETVAARWNSAAFGISGDRTDHVLWRLANGELSSSAATTDLSVMVLLIGTNDLPRNPEPSLAVETAARTAEIVETLHSLQPHMRIICAAIMPRGKGGTSTMQNIEMTNRMVARYVAENGAQQGATFVDCAHVFLTVDGALDPVLMPDFLHPSAEGMRLWVEECLAEHIDSAVSEPVLLDNWIGFHERLVREAAAAGGEGTTDLVFLGDSITESFRGTQFGEQPCVTRYCVDDASADSCVACRERAGDYCDDRCVGIAEVWARNFPTRALVLAIAGDTTRNLQWRLSNGELPDELQPKLAVLNIGTNDIGRAGRGPEETARGVIDIVRLLRRTRPGMRIVVSALFPRGEKLADEIQQTVAATNSIIDKFVNDEREDWEEGYGELSGCGVPPEFCVSFVPCGNVFLLEEEGEIDPALMGDFLHPAAGGMQLWLDCLRPFLTVG